MIPASFQIFGRSSGNKKLYSFFRNRVHFNITYKPPVAGEEAKPCKTPHFWKMLISPYRKSQENFLECYLTHKASDMTRVDLWAILIKLSSGGKYKEIRQSVERAMAQNK